MSPAPLATADLSKIKGLCLDIDDTLSTKGKLTAQAYSALWRAKEHGLWVVPLTGRPAGWCDHIARFWPVDGVVGENGGFAFFMRGGRRVRMNIEEPQPEKLAELAIAIRKNFDQAHWASDQNYREYDLAIDFCEDVEAWADEEVQRLVEFCRAQGAQAKVSSIHVNTWFGEFDKFKGFQELNRVLQGPKLDEWVFIGDSPNDEPLFEAFSNSVGVRNLGKFLPDLKHQPTYLTQGESGEGFVELVHQLTS